MKDLNMTYKPATLRIHKDRWTIEYYQTNPATHRKERFLKTLATIILQEFPLH